MSGITITDGAFGIGDTVAQRLTDLLGWRYLGEEALIEVVQRYKIAGMPAKMFELPSRWWNRLVENHTLYRFALQAALCDTAEGGSFVYHGLAGQELAPQIRQISRIFLLVPDEDRVTKVRLAKRLNHEQARRWLADMDKATDRRFKAIFGVGWRDPTRYDCVLNMAKFDVETAARLIVNLTQQIECQATLQSEQIFQDFLLEGKIRAALLTSAKNCSMDLKLQVNRGLVHVSGFLFPIDFDFKDEIIRVIQGVPGVDKVTSDIQPLPMDDSAPAIPENSL
jgi:cytidylate kinase